MDIKSDAKVRKKLQLAKRNNLKKSKMGSEGWVGCRLLVGVW